MRSLGALVVVAVVAGACGYARPEDVPNAPDDGAIGDSALVDGRPQGPLCFGAGIGRLCLTSAPTAPVVFAQNATIETDSGVCTEVIAISGIATCVIAGTTVDVSPAASVRAVGSRPLVVVASQRLAIAGLLSVGSSRSLGAGAGASSSMCPTGSPAQNGAGGGGGGAGGSFAGGGGNGGIGDINGAQNNGAVAGAIRLSVEIRAGCPGSGGGIGGGPGGGASSGGGALYLIAGTEVQISGSVSAAGAGGSRGTDRSAGGGGGSGGMIGLDAPMVSVSGTIAANGGGGGEGGGFGIGSPGQDGMIGNTRAPGGTLGDNQGGNGGAGSGGNILGGDPGAADRGGGGGGGGGAGYIYVAGSLQQLGATISPAPDIH